MRRERRAAIVAPSLNASPSVPQRTRAGGL